MERMMLPDNRIAKEVKLQSLQVFMTAAELGSMSRAAKRLNTVQPAVSRSIAELERTIGVRLFDRHPQGIKPTPYGRALLDCGAAAFDDLRRGLRNIEALDSPDAGEVRIGCVPLLAARYLAMMPASALRFPFRRPGLKILPVRLPIAPVPISIVTVKNRALSPTAQSFIENARAVAKSFRQSNIEIERNTSR